MSQINNKKCRKYSIDYLKYGFIVSPINNNKPMCLLCEKELSNESMKSSKLKDHFYNMHPTVVGKDIVYFELLKEKFEKRKSITPFVLKKGNNNDGLFCSYKISKLIAKQGYSHLIGEKIILHAVEKILKTVVHHIKPQSIIKSIPLSNDTIRRRIDEMAENVKISLCQTLQTHKFGLQLDESTLPGNEALLLGYARFITDSKIRQELLFIEELKTDTRGESIFLVVKRFLDLNSIPIKNIIACATDGAPALTGKHIGFLSYLKAQNPNVFSILSYNDILDLFFN